MIMQEFSHAIANVPGRMYARHIRPDAPELLSAQKWVSEGRPFGKAGWGPNARLHAEIRFDDSCRNGHATFAITAMISGAKRHDDNGSIGCAHDDIAKRFPELAHLIKWDLCSTDGPMWYVANAVYLAGDRDHWGKRAGEVSSSEKAVAFGDFPIPFKVKASFAAWLAQTLSAELDPCALSAELVPIAVAHEDLGKPGKHQFAPKYQFAGQPPLRWHECPFDTELQAEQFAAALINHSPRLLDIPTAWSEGKARDLDGARRAAVWPDATDAELMAEPAELRAALEARLPGLIDAFRADMAAAGLAWSPAELQGE